MPDFIEPKYYFPSIKTFPQTYWCTSTIHSSGPAFAFDWVMASALLCLITYRLNHANETNLYDHWILSELPVYYLLNILLWLVILLLPIFCIFILK